MGIRYQILAAGGVYDFVNRVIVMPNRADAAWQEYQTWITEGNSPLPPDAIGQDDLATAKAKRQAEINLFASGLRNTVIRGRSGGEMASWAIKLAEARAYASSGNQADAPTLSTTAAIRGISVEALVGKVLEQAAPFLQAEAVIDGYRGKHCDAVDAMIDVQSIIAYDWHTGWPVIPT